MVADVQRQNIADLAIDGASAVRELRQVIFHRELVANRHPVQQLGGHDLWQVGRLVARPDQRLNRARSVCFSSTDRGRHSGNEHSSAYRQLPVVIFKWLPPSDASMMCGDLSYVTMALAPAANTMVTKANSAC